MKEIQLVITNPTGLHARPAAQLVQTAAGFKSKIKIAGNGKAADAKSILGVMSMGIAQGTMVTITAAGEDEEACLLALKELITNNFG